MGRGVTSLPGLGVETKGGQITYCGWCSLRVRAAVAAVVLATFHAGRHSRQEGHLLRSLRACTAVELVPILGATTANQGVGSYAAQKLTRGKETLVRFFLTEPAGCGFDLLRDDEHSERKSHREQYREGDVVRADRRVSVVWDERCSDPVFDRLGRLQRRS